MPCSPSDAITFATDEAGQPLTRWDGRTTKPHPVTGEPVPDEAAQIPLERYTHPRPASWPQADYIVGNPPFIGAAAMRQALGDGYTEALRAAWPEVPDSADFVMFWWHHAADLTRRGQVQRFGFITPTASSNLTAAYWNTTSMASRRWRSPGPSRTTRGSMPPAAPPSASR
jgi:hypothetical protein